MNTNGLFLITLQLKFCQHPSPPTGKWSHIRNAHTAGITEFMNSEPWEIHTMLMKKTAFLITGGFLDTSALKGPGAARPWLKCQEITVCYPLQTGSKQKGVWWVSQYIVCSDIWTNWKDLQKRKYNRMLHLPSLLLVWLFLEVFSLQYKVFSYLKIFIIVNQISNKKITQALKWEKMLKKIIEVLRKKWDRLKKTPHNSICISTQSIIMHVKLYCS